MDALKKSVSLLLCVWVVLLLPLLFSWYFNQSYSLFWFLRAATGTLLLALLCFHLGQLCKNPWFRGIVILILFSALAFYLCSRVVSFYLQGESFNDRFFFHANPGTLIEAAGTYPKLLVVSLLYMALLPALAIYRSVTAVPQAYHKSARTLSVSVLLLLVVEPDLNGLLSKQITSAMADDISLASMDWEGSGLHLEALEQRLDGVTAGKNLVLIYLESLEKVYTEESIFPGLTPFLSSLKTNSLYFSDVRQTAGASWTVAGILASQCGTPLLTPLGPNGNDILQNGFLNEATCMGDLLNSAGYHQIFVGGASTRFAGKDTFLRLHGYDEVLGLDELAPTLDNPAYLNNWGLYDDSTFAAAEQKFNELASDISRPFNLTVLTVDTHHPVGTPSRSCTPYEGIKNTILDAVHCSDFLLEQFIAKLQQHPAWKDTVVVISSDHLAMRNIAQDLYPENYSRELFVAALNTGESRDLSYPATHMDLAPTMLNLLGVQHDQLFLAGDNLLDTEISKRNLNFADPERLATIKFVNYNLMTRRFSNLCSQPELLKTVNGNFRIASRDAYLAVGGRRIPLENLRDRHSWVVLINQDGTIQSTISINTRNLPFLLYQARDYLFLVVTSAVAASQLTDEDTGSGISVLFGSMQGSIRQLGAYASPDAVSIEVDCPSMLQQARDDIMSSVVVSLADICKDTSQTLTTFDSNAQQIRFSKVAVANNWYSAVLQGDAEGIYHIVEQTSLGLINTADPLNYCHAYLGRSEVLVPIAQSEAGPVSLKLVQIPGTNDQFQLVSE